MNSIEPAEVQAGFRAVLSLIAAKPVGLDRLDWAEAVLVKMGGSIRVRGMDADTCPTIHRFTPGLYAREIHMPAGAVEIGRASWRERV